MAIPVSAQALTTVANARMYVKRDQNNTPMLTDKLQLFINAFSRAAHRYTGRQFMPLESPNVSKKFYYAGDGFLPLSRTELKTVSQVTLHTDLAAASWRVLSNGSATVESEYRLEPRNATPEGTYLSIVLPDLLRLPSGAIPMRRSPDRLSRGFEVTIKGEWGAGAIPEDVELAVLIAVANQFQNPEDFPSRSMGPLSFSDIEQSVIVDESGTSLPRASRALLSPYRRRNAMG